MAQVYIARQQLVDRLVAVKVLSAAFSMNPGVVKRFFREAKVIGALENQENTVRIYDMGETDDKRLFIAMELLKGEELSERIRREPLSPGEAFPIVRQVACSLSAAHKRGIIHRDLKPDNIFLT
jgi:serine/threonine-protein kinase